MTHFFLLSSRSRLGNSCGRWTMLPWRRSKSAEVWRLWRDVAKFHTHAKFVTDTWLVQYAAMEHRPLCLLEIHWQPSSHTPRPSPGDPPRCQRITGDYAPARAHRSVCDSFLMALVATRADRWVLAGKVERRGLLEKVYWFHLPLHNARNLLKSIAISLHYESCPIHQCQSQYLAEESQ